MVVKKASDSVEDRYLRVSMWGGGQFSPGGNVNVFFYFYLHFLSF